MTKWEYRVLEYSEHSTDYFFQAGLNGMGADGWELVTAAERNTRMCCVFKRPIVEAGTSGTMLQRGQGF